MDTEKLKNNGFMTPPKHVDFYAKQFFAGVDGIRDAAVAYIEPNGGLHENHTHTYNHIFLVVDGQITVCVNGAETVVETDGYFYVDGKEPHMMYNSGKAMAKVIGITTEEKSE